MFLEDNLIQFLSFFIKIHYLNNSILNFDSYWPQNSDLKWLDFLKSSSKNLLLAYYLELNFLTKFNSD